jgi:tetrathionate reductase subunit B
MKDNQEGLDKVSRSEPRREFLKLAGMGAVGLLASASLDPVEASTAKSKGVHWGFLVDARKCIGCEACVVACKTENRVPLGVFRTTVKMRDHGEYPKAKRDFLPIKCNHCEDAPCVEECPTDIIDHRITTADGRILNFKGKAATYKRPDGPVLVDFDKCTGCGLCVTACAYNARYKNPFVMAGSAPEGKKLPVADKCTLCIHRLEKGLAPACVNTCLGGARIAGDLNDPRSEISRILAANKNKVKVLLKDEKTGPECFYLGLDELDQTFNEGMDVRDAMDEE